MFDPSTVKWASEAAAARGQPYLDSLNERRAYDPQLNGAQTVLVNSGAIPQDGWTFRGAGAPLDIDGQNGYWVMTGSTSAPGFSAGDNPGVMQTDNSYRFVSTQPQAAPVARPVQEEAAPPPKAEDNGKTIYNDWDTYQTKARADVEGINRMPFVFPDYGDLVGLDRSRIADTFFPAAWQESGVQKTIGPNGTNIAPQLQNDFGDPALVGTTKADWPSLVQMLSDNGSIDGKQRQALLSLAEPKKLNTGFGGMGGMGMFGMMG